MKIVQNLVGLLLLSGVAVVVVTAGPPEDEGALNSCTKQEECITYSIVEEAPSLCTGETCQMKVCLTLNTGEEGCNKGAGNKISHTCLGEASANGYDPQVCNPSHTALNLDANQYGLEEYRAFGTQCKTVSAGSVAIFVLKDGRTCGDTFSDGVASCAPRDDDAGDTSCSGGGNDGNECFWKIQTPACGGGGTTTTAPAESTAPAGPAAVRIEKTVLLASGNRAPDNSCNPGKEIVSGKIGQSVVYCYIVTNTGGEPLSNIELDDDCLSFTYSRTTPLPPGASFRVPFYDTISHSVSAQACDGNVVATPSSGGGDVEDSDPAGHRITDSEVECMIETTNTEVDGKLMAHTEETCTYCACE